MRSPKRRLLVACLAVMPALQAAELNPETLKAWDEYTQAVASHMRARLGGKSPFLWIDEAPGRRERLRAGGILVSPVGGSGRRVVPQGLIHDWVGAVFIPNAALDDVLAVVHDYDRYKDFYKPTVADSKFLGRDDNEYRFSMLWRKKVLFVTAAVETEYRAPTFRPDEKRWCCLAWSTRVQEIRNCGEPTQSRLPPDTGSGYIWRLYSVSRCEEGDGGVYAELEAIVLSRDVPPYLRWLVNPIVSRLSRNSLLTSLEQTRDAVRERQPQ